MTTQNLLSLVLGIVLIVWIIYRQLTWTPVVPERMWRMPAILAIIGVVELIQGNAFTRVRDTDVAILAIELVISGGLGVAMGALAHFRPMSADAHRAYAAKNAARVAGVLPAVETRNGWFGLALWLVLIGARVGAEVWAHSSGSALLMSTGIILLTVAVNRAVRILVITQRAARHSPLAANVQSAA
ncbi:MAG: hypothetical protein HIU88_06625 [Acidobacteria bacterium]|nr:hypothetical protein [Acidobacteriota bacterium]